MIFLAVCALAIRQTLSGENQKISTRNRICNHWSRSWVWYTHINPIWTVVHLVSIELKCMFTCNLPQREEYVSANTLDEISLSRMYLWIERRVSQQIRQSFVHERKQTIPLKYSNVVTLSFKENCDLLLYQLVLVIMKNVALIWRKLFKNWNYEIENFQRKVFNWLEIIIKSLTWTHQIIEIDPNSK